MVIIKHFYDVRSSFDDNFEVAIIEKPKTRLIVTVSMGDAGDIYGNDFYFDVLHIVVLGSKDRCRVLDPHKLSFRTLQNLEKTICGRNYAYQHNPDK